MDEIFVAFEEEHLRTLFSCYTRLLVQCLKLFRFKASEYILSVSRVISVTRLGNFFIFLAINFITKVAQMFGDFLGGCENRCFLSQTGEANFWATFGKTWATFLYNIWSHCPGSDEPVNPDRFVFGLPCCLTTPPYWMRCYRQNLAPPLASLSV